MRAGDQGGSKVSLTSADSTPAIPCTARRTQSVMTAPRMQPGADRQVALREPDRDVRRDPHDDAGLGRLRRRRVGPPLDDGDAAEYLAGAEQLQDHVLAGAGMPHDPNVSRPDEAQPEGGVPLVERVLAGAAGLF